MQTAPKDVYLGLRNMALRITREKAGLAATYAPTEPWGVIMDWVVSNATATVVAFSNGHASIYLSTGVVVNPMNLCAMQPRKWSPLP